MLFVLQVVLAAVFAIAGAAKLADQAGARHAMGEFGVPARATTPVAFILPVAELAIAVALLPNASARAAAACAAALLILFSLAIAVSMAHGRKPDCHCFGQLHSAPAGVSALLRNLALAAVAAVIVWQPSGTFSVDGWKLALLAACVALAVQGWLSYQLLRQNGRILSRLANLEASQQASGEPGSHARPVGTPAPFFSLPSLEAAPISLSSLMEPGRPLLLAFVDAGCGSCMALVPRLAEWQRRGAETLTVAVVSPGAAAENAAWAREHDLKLVVLQPGDALSRLYGIRATPSALLVDGAGLIASPIAEGSEAVVELAERNLPAATRAPTTSAGDPRVPTGVAALAGSAVALAAFAPGAEAASPERDAMRALIDEAAPRLASETKALQRATERYSSDLKPSASARSAVTRAIAAQVKELRALNEKVTSSTASTALSLDAQRLSLETIQLTVTYLTKLDRAVRAKSAGGALRALRASRKALDKSLQTGINARAALTIE